MLVYLERRAQASCAIGTFSFSSCVAGMGSLSLFSSNVFLRLCGSLLSSRQYRLVAPQSEGGTETERLACAGLFVCLIINLSCSSVLTRLQTFSFHASNAIDTCCRCASLSASCKVHCFTSAALLYLHEQRSFALPRRRNQGIHVYVCTYVLSDHILRYA